MLFDPSNEPQNLVNLQVLMYLFCSFQRFQILANEFASAQHLWFFKLAFLGVKDLSKQSWLIVSILIILYFNPIFFTLENLSLSLQLSLKTICHHLATFPTFLENIGSYGFLRIPQSSYLSSLSILLIWIPYSGFLLEFLI